MPSFTQLRMNLTPTVRAFWVVLYSVSTHAGFQGLWKHLKSSDFNTISEIIAPMKGKAIPIFYNRFQF